MVLCRGCILYPVWYILYPVWYILYPLWYILYPAWYILYPLWYILHFVWLVGLPLRIWLDNGKHMSLGRPRAPVAVCLRQAPSEALGQPTSARHLKPPSATLGTSGMTYTSMVTPISAACHP